MHRFLQTTSSEYELAGGRIFATRFNIYIITAEKFNIRILTHTSAFWNKKSWSIDQEHPLYALNFPLSCNQTRLS